jgi:hypothetical protein
VHMLALEVKKLSKVDTARADKHRDEDSSLRPALD